MTDGVIVEEAHQLDSDACGDLILHTEPWITLGYGAAEVAGIVEVATRDNLLVARRGERLLGFALSAPGLLFGQYLKILVVDRAARSQGIGQRLMGELERRAFARWPNVYLCVSDFNLPARQFYTRLGYREVGPLSDLVLAGKGEILMRKSIAAWREFRRT